MTPERKAQLRAVCEWFRPQTLPDESLDHALRYGLPEALDEIERLEGLLGDVLCQPLHGSCHLPQGHIGNHWTEGCHEGRVPRPDPNAALVRIAELKRELADTRRDVRDLQAELNRRP